MSNSALPEGWQNRVEWMSGEPYLSDTDARSSRMRVRRLMINECMVNRSLYEDCGELNTTLIAESFASEYDLYVNDSNGEPQIPNQLFDWAFEISAQVETRWQNEQT